MRNVLAFMFAGLGVICGAVFLIWLGVDTEADEYDVVIYIPFLFAAAVSWVLWRRRQTRGTKAPAWALAGTLMFLSPAGGWLYFYVFLIALLLLTATAVAPPAAAASRRPHG